MENYKKMVLQKKIMTETTLQFFQWRQIEANCWLLQQGGKLHELYILLKGRVKACSTTANGITRLSAISYPITVLGEVELLNGLPINNDVYTLEQCDFLVVSVDRFQDILLNDLIFVRFLAQQISLKLYNANHNTSISINYPVENRLAAYFVSCHDHGLIKENFVSVASLLGCSYRQLQRVLNQFVQWGYIEKKGRSHYRIIDWKNLQNLGQDIYRL